MVFDQRVAGSAHREWNISLEEAQALSAGGLFTAADIQAVAMRHYRTGLVRFAAAEAFATTGFRAAFAFLSKR